jgi:hypothetical protein
VATKIWNAQKGAQHKAAPGRGCAWYANPSTYHGRYQTCCPIVNGVQCRIDIGFSGESTVEIPQARGKQCKSVIDIGSAIA